MSSNTSTLVEKALDAAEQVGAKIEFIELADLTIGICEHCNECTILGKCKTDDDLNKVAETMKAADGIIFGSPDHYAAMGTPMKNLMDRTGRFLHLEGKVGAGIVVGRRSGTDLALTLIHFFMYVKEMIIPGTMSWPVGFALNAGDIRADTEAIAMASQLGNRVATLSSILVRSPVPWSHEPRPNGQKVRFGDEWK
jgi:multimeric flavodoxin WrbA